MENNQVAKIQPVTRSTFSGIEKAMQEAGFSIEKVKQEISFAIQIINKSEKLQKCTPDSKLQAVLNISNIGLSLNTAAKEAYLIPRWNNTIKVFECALEPSYVGLVKLLTDAGSITSNVCQIVYENDPFEIDLANNVNPVVHKPDLKKERGKFVGAYCLATLSDKTRQVEYMNLSEIEEIKGRSETYKAYLAGKISTCTWITDFNEMARKTVIKRIYKYLPRTEKMQFVDKAIQIDNSDFTATDEQLNYIESLLSSSTLEQRQRDNIDMEMSVMTASRASQVIGMLKQNQLGPDHGNLGSQAETAKHIRKISMPV